MVPDLIKLCVVNVKKTLEVDSIDCPASIRNLPRHRPRICTFMYTCPNYANFVSPLDAEVMHNSRVMLSILFTESSAENSGVVENDMKWKQYSQRSILGILMGDRYKWQVTQSTAS